MLCSNSWGYTFGCKECKGIWVFEHGTPRGSYNWTRREWLW